MVHITITSFHTNLHANERYILETLLTSPQIIQNPGKYTDHHYRRLIHGVKRKHHNEYASDAWDDLRKQ